MLIMDPTDAKLSTEPAEPRESKDPNDSKLIDDAMLRSVKRPPKLSAE